MDNSARSGIRVGRSADAPQQRLQLFKWTGASLLEDDASGDDDGYLGSGVYGTDEREFASDAGGALAHSPEPEMPVLSQHRGRRIDADAIVAHLKSEILRVSELDVQSTCL